MKAGFGNIMKQAQEMQKKMQGIQEEIANLEIQGEAGAGLVQVTMNGRHDVRRVKIDPSLLSENEDKEVLEDLLAAAFNDAVRKLEKTQKEKMSSVTGGMNLPFDLNM